MVVHVSDTSGSSFQALPITFDTGGGPNKTAAGYSSLTFVDAAKPRTVGLAWETSGPGNTCGGEAGAGSRCRILFSVRNFDFNLGKFGGYSAILWQI